MGAVILILSNSDSGLHDFRKEVLQALLQEGYRVAVSVPDTGYVEKIRGLGCEIVPTSFERRGMNPLKDMKLMLFYRRLIREYRPAAVLAYTIKPNIYGGLACRLTRQAYLCNITGLGTALEHPGPLQLLIVRLYREALKKAACVFFQNQGNREFLIKKGCVTGNSRVIPGSGVNLQEHLAKPYPPKEGPVRFVSIMRLMKDKGIDELLSAAEAIYREYPQVKFQLLGAYEEETKEYYQPLIERLQKEGIIQYYGYRDDVPDFLEGCQAVIHPSYHEGMSNVLLEAAATARPVLASDVEGCIDTFEDRVSGLSFKPQDAASLTDTLRRFLRLPYDSRREMGLAGRRFVEAKFDRRQVVQAYLEEIRKCQNSGTDTRSGK